MGKQVKGLEYHTNLHTQAVKVITGGVKVNPSFKAEGAEDKVVLVLTIDQTGYQLDGASLNNDVAPIIRNDRTYLPVRFISEALGATVNWDAVTRQVTISVA